MQEAICKLKEVIWEVCNTCHNNCSYCGSKDHTGQPITDPKLIDHILESICEYPPSEVNISGGDPMLLSYDQHKDITSKLKDVGCTVKVIVNPKSLEIEPNQLSENISKVALYDVIGLSVNTKDELKIAKDILSTINIKKNVTIITNFNTDNIWNYRDIEQFVQANNLCWQIQYTTCSDGKAIYENQEAKQYLFMSIAVSKSSGVKIVLSDNMNKGKCFAGQAGLGIMSNGFILPCLSMRGWAKEGELLQSVVGDLKKTSLKHIWITGFAPFRCNEFMCCKDICNAPYEETTQEKKVDAKKITKNLFDLTERPLPPPPPPAPLPRQTEERVFAYGVVRPESYPKPQITDYPVTIMYGVFKDDGNNMISPTWVTTSSSDRVGEMIYTSLGGDNRKLYKSMKECE